MPPAVIKFHREPTIVLATPVRAAPIGAETPDGTRGGSSTRFRYRVSMKIVSVNAWGGTLYDDLLAWLDEFDADIICLQEMTRTED